MLFFTTAAKNHKLVFTKLSDCMQHLHIIAEWAENEWGYIRNKGVEFRKEVFTQLSSNIYVGTFNDQPVAMFALIDKPFSKSLKTSFPLPSAFELTYVFVKKDYRGLGFSNQIINETKSLSLNDGKNLILLDTLKPGLNRMYEKHGAKIICENELFSHSTDVLRMSPY
jgi:GNAT superfamily N-acetyltransferase